MKASRQLGRLLSKNMEAYAPQAVFFKNLGESIRNVVWLDQLAQGVDADIVFVLSAVAASAYLPVLFLLFLQGKEPFFHLRYKRQRPET